MLAIQYKGVRCIAWKDGPGYAIMTTNLRNGCVADYGATIGTVKQKVMEIVLERLSGSSLFEETRLTEGKDV